MFCRWRGSAGRHGRLWSGEKEEEEEEEEEGEEEEGEEGREGGEAEEGGGEGAARGHARAPLLYRAASSGSGRGGPGQWAGQQLAIAQSLLEMGPSAAALGASGAGSVNGLQWQGGGGGGGGGGGEGGTFARRPPPKPPGSRPGTVSD